MNDELLAFLKGVDEANAAENPACAWIQVVIVEPLKKPYKKKIPDTLEAMMKIVGGYIQNVFLGETRNGARVALVLNEEGKLIGLPSNLRVGRFGVLAGTFFITAYNRQGDNISLSDEEADYYIRRFTPNEVY